MSGSVLQPWVQQIPIKMQSTLILGLRGYDGRETPHLKKIGKWLRGITFVPGRIDNLIQFMGEVPPLMVEKDPAYNELDFVTRHYISHLMHALEVVAYNHPDNIIKIHANGLYRNICHFFHVQHESIEDFESRLEDVTWPYGQPYDFDSAIAQLERYEREHGQRHPQDRRPR